MPGQGRDRVRRRAGPGHAGKRAGCRTVGRIGTARPSAGPRSARATDAPERGLRARTRRPRADPLRDRRRCGPRSRSVASPRVEPGAAGRTRRTRSPPTRRPRHSASAGAERGRQLRACRPADEMIVAVLGQSGEALRSRSARDRSPTRSRHRGLRQMRRQAGDVALTPGPAAHWRTRWEALHPTADRPVDRRKPVDRRATAALPRGCEACFPAARRGAPRCREPRVFPTPGIPRGNASALNGDTAPVACSGDYRVAMLEPLIDDASEQPHRR